MTDVPALAAARLATAWVGGESPEAHSGQGLLVALDGEAPVVLTCHHVVAPLTPETLRVRLPTADGGLGPPLAARYDPARSRPEQDAAVLVLDTAKPPLFPGRFTPAPPRGPQPLRLPFSSHEDFIQELRERGPNLEPVVRVTFRKSADASGAPLTHLALLATYLAGGRRLPRLPGGRGRGATRRVPRLHVDRPNGPGIPTLPAASRAAPGGRRPRGPEGDVGRRFGTGPSGCRRLAGAIGYSAKSVSWR